MTDNRDDAEPGQTEAQSGASSPFDEQTQEIPRPSGGYGGGAWAAPTGGSSSASTSRWSRLGQPVQPARFSAGAPRGAEPSAADPAATAAMPTPSRTPQGYSEVLDEDDLGVGGATEQIPRMAAPERTEQISHATEEVPRATGAPDAGRPAADDPLATAAMPRQTSGDAESAGGEPDVPTNPVPSAGAPTQAFSRMDAPPVDVGGQTAGYRSAHYEPSAKSAPYEPLAYEPAPPGNYPQESAWTQAGAYQQDPAPGYGQPPAAAPVQVPPSADAPRGRGTVELGLLVLRLLLGGLLIVEGLRTALGTWGGPGLSGTESLLASWGFDYARILAVTLASIELGAGVLIIVGLATPLAASAVVLAMLAVWLGDQLAPGEPYVLPVGNERALFLGGAAVALALAGPGKISLDSAMKWATRPRFGSLFLLLLGIVGGIAAWLVLTGRIGG
jgi:putative oxidoreductase